MNSRDKLEELHGMTRQKPQTGLPSFFYVLPILHLLIALPFAYYLNIWADEGSTLYTTQNGFFQTLQNTLADEKQAPVYFLLMSLWRSINDSIFFARLFAIFCSLGSIAIFYKIVRKFWNDNTAVFATFFFAIHPYLLFVSLEIRVYSLMVLLSLLMTKLFMDGFLERRKSILDDKKKVRNRTILFVLISIFSLYTNYYLGFLLVGFFVPLLILRRWNEAKNYILQMLVVGIAILPLIWAIKMQFEVNTGGHFQSTDPIEGIKMLWNHFLTFVLPTEIYSPENQTFVSFIRIWFVRVFGLFTVGFLIYKRRIFEGKILIFGTISVVVFGFLYLAYFSLSGLYIEIRHAAVWFSPICLFTVAILTESLPQRKFSNDNSNKVYAVIALAVLLMFFYVYGIYSIYPEFVKRGDWERVSEYIEQTEKPNQPIIVFTNYEALNLPIYYEGENKILPQTNYFKWNYEAEMGSPNVWTKQIEYVISVIPESADEIWLVTEEGCQATKGCEPLEKFVKENYTIIETKDFYKERVRLLRKK